MAKTKQVDCQVEVDSQWSLGVYANAFRVGEGKETERVLDFFQYSEADNVAQLVSRVRVHQEMIPGIQAQLGEVLRDLSDPRYDGFRVVADIAGLN